MLDDVDRRILRQMQAAPDLSNADLADRCGVTAATCWRRIERMQESNVLKGQGATLDWTALGYAVEVSLRITLDKTQARAFDEFQAAARDVPEVLEIQTFVGRVDTRLSVIARDMEHYQQIYRERILTLPHIADIESLMLISRIKDSQALPL